VKGRTKEVYQTQEFARLAGVTVRALHHYDRLGLLRPKHRSRAGYRLYSANDFARLEQIVVLKFLGMPLQQIKSLLAAEARLADALRRQKSVLLEKRIQIDRAIQAISNAQRSFEPRGAQDLQLLQQIIQEIAMQNSTDWTKKYYSPEAQAKVEDRKKLWSPELQERVSREWTQLTADVEAALGEDPSSPRAQALAARWRNLVEQFTGGDPGILMGLRAMWQDKANWPESAREAYGNKFAIKPEVHAFIMRAMHPGK
jgi:DNA-binding transcriptional MerR regulator